MLDEPVAVTSLMEVAWIVMGSCFAMSECRRELAAPVSTRHWILFRKGGIFIVTNGRVRFILILLTLVSIVFSLC